MYPFAEGDFAPKNAWYVIATCEEVTRTPMERSFLDEPVALYRREDGRPVALHGRCPHRFYPLGKSTLSGDQVVCGYHGISFDADGACTGIPSLGGRVPGTGYSIRRYPVREMGPWVWIWGGDPALADSHPLPDLSMLGLPSPAVELRSLAYHTVACRYQLLNDNLLDLTHLAYLHATNIGSQVIAASEEERTRHGEALVSKRYIRDLPLAALPALQLIDLRGYQGNVERAMGMYSFLPGFHCGLDETVVSQSDPARSGERLFRTLVFHAVTPASRTSSHYFFGLGLEQPELFDLLSGYLKAPLSEDMFASEEIERKLAPYGEGAPRELLLRSDAHAVEGRKVIQAMMNAEKTHGC